MKQLAAEIVGSLKASPALLALILLNLIFVGGVGVYLDRRQADTSRGIGMLIDKCGGK